MAADTYLVGRGIADITGEPAEAGMLGYGKAEQRTAGLHTRQRARAFVIEAGGTRVLLVVTDLPLIFDSIRLAVLRALAERYGETYTSTNVMLTATHTHCGPGGYSHHLLYNATGGFRPRTFAAIVDGITEAVQRAHDDVGPAELTLAHGELHDASANRSRTAFDRNPAADRARFPGAIDPQTTLLRITRGDALVGAVNWFATHNTSMTNTNLLISSDNKGYAGYHWERLVEGVDHLAEPTPAFIAAFAQTNAGDMSPNLELQPGTGPTDDEFENTRIIGLRQYEAAAKLLSETGVAVTGPVDVRSVAVDLSDVAVSPAFTGDGRSHRTSHAVAGAAAFAGAWADGPGFPGFRAGHHNPFWDGLSRRVLYPLARRLRDSQSPKSLLFPGGVLNRVRPVVAERVLLQLLRIGHLYLVGVPGEVTIVAGLRLRRTVAEIVGADVADVLVAGYSNGYIHYVTTPEEYDSQEYEGGSTLFGRWELPALQQVCAGLATAMRDGTAIPPGPGIVDVGVRPKARRDVPDVAAAGRVFGEPLIELNAGYRPGERVTVAFVGAHPNNDLHRGGTYLEIQREHDGRWQRVLDDGDWCTRLHWARGGTAGSVVTITWDIPADVVPGSYRVRYHGDACTGTGWITPFSGTSTTFTVHGGDQRVP